MKRINSSTLILVVLLFFSTFITRSGGALHANTLDSLNQLSPMPHHRSEVAEIIRILRKKHYHKVGIDNDLSGFVLKTYIERLDPAKLYFLQQDINYFTRRYGKKLDDMLKAGQLEVPYQLYNLFREKALARFPFILASLEHEPDYGIDEYFELDYKKRKWAKNNKVLNMRWQKRLKNETLNLKLAGKDWKGAQKLMKERYLRFKKNIGNRKSEDVFELFMNAFTNAFDPHTNYFLPVSSENFQISMSRSLEGIGARLQEELDNTVVFEVVAGGPAFKGGELKKNDKIIAVAQGDEGEFVDIIGWRLDEVVQLIRGKKGTVVRLRVLSEENVDQSQTKDIRIVRDKIKLENALAKHEIHRVEHNQKAYEIGVIKVPDFYIDWKGAEAGEINYRKCTRDVARLIDTLEQARVDAILIDLRNNGGGALSEAVEMSGLFIDKGAIVQVKDHKGNIYVNSDPDPMQHYAGPMAVLVNRFSASASEIFAAAIQDYGRGTIMGEATYGKGSVQNLINLKKTHGGGGQLKLTLAKYYRINGKSTQSTGVEPDLYLPTSYDETEYREVALESALPSDEIRQLPIKKTNDVSYATIAHLQEAHLEAKEANKTWKAFIQEVEEKRKKRKETYVSLLYEKRKADMDKGKKDEENTNSTARWKKDPYLQQSLYLLHELVALDKNKS